MKQLLIAQIDPPQNIKTGDFYYRSYVPGVSMSGTEGIYVVNMTGEHRLRDEIAAIADILILSNICDPDYFPIINKRKTRNLPTFYEIGDNFSAVPAWNPVHFFYKLKENRILFQQLAKACDGLQFTCNHLREIYGHLQPNHAVFMNHLLELPPAKKGGSGGNVHVVVGWGGSQGHHEDIAEIAGPLMQWMENRPDVSLHLMCSDKIWSLFNDLPNKRKKRTTPGAIEKYYEFLSRIDIGIIPLKDSAFNRCRSDIKFVEYSAAGLVSVVRRLEPYRETVRQGETGLLYDTPLEMIACLDRLTTEGCLANNLSQAAHSYVLTERQQRDNTLMRLDFYLKTGGAKLGMEDGSRNLRDLFQRWSSYEGAVSSGRYLNLRPGQFERLLQDGLVIMQIDKEAKKARKYFELAAQMEQDHYLPFLFGAPVAQNPVQNLFRALQLKPDSLKAWVMMGDYLATAGNVVEAFGAYETAAKICRDYTAPFAKATDLLSRIGRKEEAERMRATIKQMTAELVS